MLFFIKTVFLTKKIYLKKKTYKQSEKTNFLFLSNQTFRHLSMFVLAKTNEFLVITEKKLKTFKYVFYNHNFAQFDLVFLRNSILFTTLLILGLLLHKMSQPNLNRK